MSLGDVGKVRRLGRLFQSDNRSLIVGFDHAVSVGTVGGALNSLPALARTCIDSGADGLQMGLNAIRSLPEGLVRSQTGVVLRIDRSPVNDDVHQVVGGSNIWATSESVAQADGDAVVVFFIHDVRDEAVTANHAAAVGSIAAECRRYGVPVMVEVMTKTASTSSSSISADMVDAARIAFELGADVLKIDRTPDSRALADVVAAAPVPVLLRGGMPSHTVGGTVSVLEECMRNGFAGGVYGRSVWQADNPASVVRELAAVIHGKGRLD